MIHRRFDHTYLINLEERYDRLARVSANCSTVGLEFERFPAIHYSTVDVLKENSTIEDLEVKKNHWTKGAVALIRTTIKILEDAKEKGYKSILILEDDVTFIEDFNENVNSNFKFIPSDWEMILFAGLHMKSFDTIAPNIARVNGTECLHCYAIKDTIYDVLLDLLKSENKPLDHYTAYDIQPRGKSYCFLPNLVYQYSSYSNIVGKVVDYEFLRVM